MFCKPQYFDEIFGKLKLNRYHPIVKKFPKACADQAYTITKNSAYRLYAHTFAGYIENNYNEHNDEWIQRLISGHSIHKFGIYYKYSSNDFLITKFVTDYCRCDLDIILQYFRKLNMVNLVETDLNSEDTSKIVIMYNIHLIFLLAQIFLVFEAAEEQMHPTGLENPFLMINDAFNHHSVSEKDNKGIFYYPPPKWSSIAYIYQEIVPVYEYFYHLNPDNLYNCIEKSIDLQVIFGCHKYRKQMNMIYDTTRSLSGFFLVKWLVEQITNRQEKYSLELRIKHVPTGTYLEIEV